MQRFLVSSVKWLVGSRRAAAPPSPTPPGVVGWRLKVASHGTRVRFGKAVLVVASCVGARPGVEQRGGSHVSSLDFGHLLVLATVVAYSKFGSFFWRAIH